MPDNIKTEVEFHAVVLKVEQRTTKIYDDPKFGEAQTEAEAAPRLEPNGWWVVLDGWPIAIRFGNLRPHVEPGDTMIIQMRVAPKPKPGDPAPVLNLVPPAPAAPAAAETVS